MIRALSPCRVLAPVRVVAGVLVKETARGGGVRSVARLDPWLSRQETHLPECLTMDLPITLIQSSFSCEADGEVGSSQEIPDGLQMEPDCN